MEKDEILKKSRDENKGTDEYERMVLAFSGKVSAQVGMLICCIVNIIKVIFTGKISYESWMIYFSILGTLFLVKYIKMRKKHELYISILYIALFIFFTVFFILQLIG